MSSITGKVIAITGAGTGMGEADALLLAERGARVVLGDLREDRLKSVPARITDAGGEVIYTTADVRQRDALQALVQWPSRNTADSTYSSATPA